MLNKELLIALVRDEISLWDNRSKAYRDREQKPVTWDKIGKTLNITGKEAQKAWELLRDSYRKMRIKELTGKAKKECGWPYYSSLAFLNEVLSPRALSFKDITGSSEPDDELQYSFKIEGDDSSSNVDYNNYNQFDNQPYVEIEETQIKPSIDQQIFTTEPNLRKRKRTGEEEHFWEGKHRFPRPETKIVKDCDHHWNNRFERDPTTPPARDDDYLFLMSLLPSIQRLKDVQKMKLRIEILTSVTRELEKSVQQESSSSNS